MRLVKKIHTAKSAPIEDLTTFKVLPTDSIKMEELNPFIFLNHHGPQKYPQDNNGLPFGPHPHRGIETVTFIIDGSIMHKDNGGHESIITSGGIQWMSAGSGLIHSEVSSAKFKKEGGGLEILQLWLNLPADNKLDDPHYKGLQKDEIPSKMLNADKVKVNIIAGEIEGIKGPCNTVTGVSLCTMELDEGGKYSTKVPSDYNIFLYVIKGEIKVNGSNAKALHLVEFDHNSEEIQITAAKDSMIIFGYAKPLKERIVAYGPFVMNTEPEIMQAYDDLRKGKFGAWR